MLLLLGRDSPELLVQADKDADLNDFNFWVVNGHWKGQFREGSVRITEQDYKTDFHDGYKIICSDQERLKEGHNLTDRGYNSVFDKFK